MACQSHISGCGLAAAFFAPLFLLGCGSVTEDEAKYTDIILNEVQSKDSDGYIAEDYVELYNASEYTYTFSDGEWYLSDADEADEDSTHAFYIPAGTEIKGHGYLVLLPDCATLPDDAPTESIVNDDTSLFGLGKEDGVYLYYLGSDAVTPTTPVDSTSWTAHVMTRVRYPDGDDWDSEDSHIPTPGAANSSATSEE